MKHLFSLQEKVLAYFIASAFLLHPAAFASDCTSIENPPIQLMPGCAVGMAYQNGRPTVANMILVATLPGSVNDCTLTSSNDPQWPVTVFRSVQPTSSTSLPRPYKVIGLPGVITQLPLTFVCVRNIQVDGGLFNYKASVHNASGWELSNINGSVSDGTINGPFYDDSCWVKKVPLAGVDMSFSSYLQANYGGTAEDLCGPSGNLPVKLISFTGRTTGNAVQLDWESASEINFNHYEVERLETTDFKPIGHVAGRGQAAKYGLTDHPTASGSIQYRLKLVDNNGTYQYSNIVRVEFRGQADFSVYPNPIVASQPLHVVLGSTAGESSLLRVLNAQGQLVFERRLNGQGNLQRSRRTGGQVVFTK